MAVYDSIAEPYKKALERPYRLHVMNYTYFNLLGDIAGKSILDLACGEGLYTRKLKLKGAARVVGVDISEKMLSLAKLEETRQPLGIEYILCDVRELGEIGSFDLVVATFLLNYAQSKEQLLSMCQTIYANLKPGGRFVTINGNLELPPEFYPLLEKYGVYRSVSEPLQPGVPINITLKIPGSKETVSFDIYYLSHATYEWAFRTVGFTEIRWHKMSVSPEGLSEFGREFWQDVLDHPYHIAIECLK